MIDYYTNLKNVIENTKDLQVVVMAGGFDQDLTLYKFIPKLLPYKDKTLIEHVIKFYSDQKLRILGKLKL